MVAARAERLFFAFVRLGSLADVSAVFGPHCAADICRVMGVLLPANAVCTAGTFLQPAGAVVAGAYVYFSGYLAAGLERPKDTSSKMALLGCIGRIVGIYSLFRCGRFLRRKRYAGGGAVCLPKGFIPVSVLFRRCVWGYMPLDDTQSTV